MQEILTPYWAFRSSHVATFIQIVLHGYFLLIKHSILEAGGRFIRVKKLRKFSRLMKQETHKAPCGAAKALNRCRQEEAEQSAAPCKMDRELQGSNFHESSITLGRGNDNIQRKWCLHI